MSRVDRWPSTPMKLILAWVLTLATAVVTFVLVLLNRSANATVYDGWLAFLAAYDGITAFQFKAKRETAWPAPETKSEVTQPAGSGQPAVAASATFAGKPVPTMGPMTPQPAPTDTLGEEGP